MCKYVLKILKILLTGGGMMTWSARLSRTNDLLGGIWLSCHLAGRPNCLGLPDWAHLPPAWAHLPGLTCLGSLAWAHRPALIDVKETIISSSEKD